MKLLYLCCLFISGLLPRHFFAQCQFIAQEKFLEQTEIESNCLAVPHNPFLFNENSSQQFINCNENPSQHLINFLEINQNQSISEEYVLQQVRYFVDNGADVNLFCNNGYSLLQEIVKGRNHLFVKVLLACGAQVDLASQSGETALHIAAKKGYLEIVKTLIQSDAILKVNDCYGKTPQDYALQWNHMEVFNYLNKVELIFYRILMDSVFDLDWDAISRFIVKLGNSNNLYMDSILLASLWGLNSASKKFFLSQSLQGQRLQDQVNAIYNDVDKMNKLERSDHQNFLSYANISMEFLKHSVDEQFLIACLSCKNLPIFAQCLSHHKCFSSMPFDHLHQFFLYLSKEDKILWSSLDHKGSHLSMTSSFWIFLFLEKTCEEENDEDRIEVLNKIKTMWGWATNKIEDLMMEGINDNTMALIKYQLQVVGGNPNMKPLILSACKKNNLELVQLLVQYGAWVDRAFLGEFPIDVAIQYGSKEIMTFLIEQGANIHRKNDQKMTTLHVAIKNNRVDIVTFLLNKGVSINSQNTNGLTPLNMAVSLGYKDIVAILLNKGAEINTRDINGLSPLHYACWRSDAEIISLLTSRDDLNVNVQDIKHVSPINISLMKKDSAIVDCLLRYDHDPLQTDIHGRNVFYYTGLFGNILVFQALSQRISNINHFINCVDKFKNTLLHVAVFYGFYSFVKFLVENGVDVEKVNALQTDEIPQKFVVSLSEKMNRLFADQRERFNYELFNKVKMIPFHGCTPLHIACMGINYKIAFYLMDKCQINVVDEYGKTPLHYACEKANILTILNLIDKGCDVTIVDSFGKKALDYYEQALSDKKLTAKLSQPMADCIGKMVADEKRYTEVLSEELAKKGMSDDKDNLVSAPTNLNEMLQRLRNKDQKERRTPLEEDRNSVFRCIFQRLLEKDC